MKIVGVDYDGCNIVGVDVIVNESDRMHLKPVVHGYWVASDTIKLNGEIVRAGDRMPTADGEPYGSCYCSECGEWLVGSDEYPVHGYYCPNCGARMDGNE